MWPSEVLENFGVEILNNLNCVKIFLKNISLQISYNEAWENVDRIERDFYLMKLYVFICRLFNFLFMDSKVG